MEAPAFTGKVRRIVSIEDFLEKWFPSDINPPDAVRREECRRDLQRVITAAFKGASPATLIGQQAKLLKGIARLLLASARYEYAIGTFAELNEAGNELDRVLNGKKDETT
jgi:hypothetical protein